MERKRAGEAEDHISKLPVPILHKFLSLLEAKEAAQMSTFSKSWYTAWSSMSYLNFGHRFFHHKEDDSWKLSENIPELVNIVDQTLANRQKQKISIQQFFLRLPSGNWCSYVRSWIKTLVVSNIQELDLYLENLNPLPDMIFAAERLTILGLGGFKLELPRDGIKWSVLQVLCLKNVFWDEQLFQALCGSCSGLEDLTLIHCHGLASLQIAGALSKLKKVFLDVPEFQIIDIVAPNLEDVSVHRKSEVLKITCCQALKRLNLSKMYVTDYWLEDLLLREPNIEDLNLLLCVELNTIKISSDRLKYLSLSSCYALDAVEVDAPNLISFSYLFSPLLPSLKLNASVNLDVKLRFFSVPSGRFHTDWYTEVMKFLGNFKQSKAIKLICHYKDAMVIPKDMRKIWVPPLYGADCRHILFDCRGKYSLVDVVDSLLWISPQLSTLSFVGGSDINSTLKFIYKDAAVPWKCWKGNLEEVKMENFTCTKQRKLRKLLFHKK